MLEERSNSPFILAGAVLVIALTGLVVWSSLKQPEAASSNAYVDGTVVARLETQSRPATDGSSMAASKPQTLDAADPSMITDSLMALIQRMLSGPRVVPNEALLTFRSKAAQAAFMRKAAGYGLRLVGTVNGLNAVRVGFDDPHALRDYLAAAGADKPTVEANYWLAVPHLPKSDETNQGGAVPVHDLFSDINATGDRSQWGKGVTVAVLDTGVKDHLTFAPGQVTHVDLLNDGKPFHSHGTSVASLIAGQDEQAPGVAPATQLLDIRVADEKGYSVTSMVAQGIIEAVDRGANLINISLGGYDDSPILRQAVAYAASKGVPIFAAAGNDGYTELAYPAAISSVVSVGSVAGDDKQAYFSNSGNNLDFAAPGVGLTTAWDTNKIASVSGTSQSSAVATGVAAATLSMGISASNLDQQLKQRARATGATKDKVGAGVIQLPAH